MRKMSDDSFIPSSSKEREKRISVGGGGEKVPVIEVGRAPEVPKETGIEKLEKEQYLLKNVVRDDQTGQVLVKPANQPAPKIVLPFDDEEELKEALEKKSVFAIRWLAELVKRLKMRLGSKVGFINH